MKTTEIYTKNELKAKAEIAMMGMITPIRDKDNIIFVVDYILNVLEADSHITGEDVYNLATRYTEKESDIVGISTCRLLGMNVINLVFKDKGDTHYKLDSEDGVLTYVFNINAPDLSELGYCFFEKAGGGFYHRIA